ncbi:LacI family DNA-binding transcriptional regulator [Paenibacillus caseinilyticus]|uniref:LacI family transcriptional regulator n=1 Tax=Paenibacillus mucilaginosus K02 TaxID=997761 RepID=I0BLP1_9BACL|nr:LacI family DNA-binding transcriptional regulator [Paenibacillus mucilaginosus]AFH63288.1 LacI family transcriptional regulator [Paenibacillus mucilaginosus K02]WFA19564.1 LacI family transcriptional regulator [Paenibacillus mucilaginosus]
MGIGTVKMEDIARLAGVSKAAVSLALSGKPGISEGTRERILQLASEHGYAHKSKAAVSAQGPRTLTFLAAANAGIVLEDYYQQPFFRELIHFIEERCRARGYSLIYSSMEPEPSAGELRALAEEKRSEGVILLGTNLNRSQVAFIAGELPLPLVVLDTCFDTLPLPFVEINNVMGAYQAGSHLCAAGHRTVGYIESNVRIHNFDERRRGFELALLERGMEFAGDEIFSVAPTILSSQESLKSQLAAYLDAGNSLPEAFFCECDYIAISAIKTLNELGYRVPEDVSVVGFDNISEARIVSPELTTVHVEKERMAHLAVELLIESIESAPGAKAKIKVDTRLVERHSSRSPVRS